MGKEKPTSKSVDLGGPRARSINLNPQPYIQSRGRKYKPADRDYSGSPPIERTQSWEWKEAQKENFPPEDIYDKVSEYVTLSKLYFGKRKPQRSRTSIISKQSSLNHAKPFYPAGSPRSPLSEEHAARVAFARWIYQLPTTTRVRAGIFATKAGTERFYFGDRLEAGMGYPFH
ncbi:unnamed protein product [Rodentolepis nana]|uniref:Cilia- and flagella-associated protein 126 n=1 Tax=Rodentolepis nana TaxID=102285 RepID=A0A0R3TVE0_RODNA|nr:unnamed protein product [Rodentolepis nana]